MEKYTVQELSKLAGVSVRTLHHYDEIGLLKPAYRSEKGYRYYTRNELLRLQQVMFYRVLDMPLKDIVELMDASTYDALKALEQHKQALHQRLHNMNQLIKTIDKTINAMKQGSDILTDEELYEGFTKEQTAEMRAEVIERWGADKLLESENNAKKLDKEQWQHLKEQAEDIARQFAAVSGFAPGSMAVQQVVQAHYNHISMLNDVCVEHYAGLGRLYVDDARFTIFYDKHKPGLSQFICDAIQVFCANGLKA